MVRLNDKYEIVINLSWPVHVSLWLWRVSEAVARRPGIAAAVLGSAWILMVAARAIQAGTPLPMIHDEFSYLLNADTFAHGRLTNPPHPLSEFFESQHILSQPTYASKYPPLRGLFLAFGQVTTGYPIVGEWLCGLLMVLATWWALRAWLPPIWALVGGELALLHRYSTFWAFNYWGGLEAALGGALVLGAIGRLLRHDQQRHGQWRHGLVLGVGLVILAASRPFEGLCVTIAAGAACLWVFGLPRTWRAMLRAAVPATVVLVPCAIWLGYYNYRVTGNWLTMPYVAHENAYSPAPSFLFQGTRPMPHYANEQLSGYHIGINLNTYTAQQTFAGYMREKLAQIRELVVEPMRDSWLIALPLLCVPFVIKTSRAAKFAGVIVTTMALALASELWIFAHYGAPAFAAGILLIVLCIRYLHAAALLRPLWIRTLVVLFVIALVILAIEDISRAKPLKLGRRRWMTDRERVLTILSPRAGKHVVVVRYAPGHSVHNDWVYNGADIDASRVIWARDMGADDVKLETYYPDRQFWIAVVADRLLALTPHKKGTPFTVQLGDDAAFVDKPWKADDALAAIRPELQ